MASRPPGSRVPASIRIPEYPHRKEQWLRAEDWTLPVEHLRHMPGPGWALLVEELHRQLLKLDPGYGIVSMKEKLGGLRFYAKFDPEVRHQAQRLIRQVEARSFKICGLCGAPGRLRIPERARIDTFCDFCADRVIGDRPTRGPRARRRQARAVRDRFEGFRRGSGKDDGGAT